MTNCNVHVDCTHLGSLGTPKITVPRDPTIRFGRSSTIVYLDLKDLS